MMSPLRLLLASSTLACALAFRPTGLPRTAQQLRVAASQTPNMLLNQRSAGSVAAAGLALALSTATPQLVVAALNPPAVVQQYGSSMLAEEELRPAQKKFLEERAARQQEYDEDFSSTFKTAKEVKDKKSAYTLVVAGLVAVAFIAPMIQFFYYTGGD